MELFISQFLGPHDVLRSHVNLSIVFGDFLCSEWQRSQFKFEDFSKLSRIGGKLIESSILKHPCVHDDIIEDCA